LDAILEWLILDRTKEHKGIRTEDFLRQKDIKAKIACRAMILLIAA